MVDFYTNILGFKYIGAAQASEDKSRAAGFSLRGYEIVRLQTNYGERLKLTRPVETSLDRFDDTHILDRQGTIYLTFLVADASAIARRLKSAGIKVKPSDGLVEVRPGVRLCTAQDPEGNYLEFVVYDDLVGYRKDP